ncbi:MAG: competence protein ComEA [Thermoleophilaceae bacterium]|jgi:competence protein ComEA|nr:competence protein ComEA [Thermoleophilaceae bacterium]
MDDRRKLEIAGWALAAFVVVLLGARFAHGKSSAPAAPVSVKPAASSPHRGAGKPLVVDVAGEVRRPGLQRVPHGSRAGDAVRAAGGMTGRADGAAVNLAAPLADGQQVVVPRRGAAAAGAVASSADPAAAGGAPSAPVSLSTATVAQLDTIDGIGPTLAGRIVQYRTEHGGFRSVSELQQVDGIGEQRFATLKQAVTP